MLPVLNLARGRPRTEVKPVRRGYPRGDTPGLYGLDPGCRICGVKDELRGRPGCDVHP